MVVANLQNVSSSKYLPSVNRVKQVSTEATFIAPKPDGLISKDICAHSSPGKANFYKRARSKYVSTGLGYGLFFANPDSPLRSSYIGSTKCCDKLTQEGKKIKSANFCGQRWCLTCNRIKTAKLMDAYSPVLEGFKDPQFVTLTKLTVTADQLLDSIIKMGKVWRKITNLARKKRINFKGIRKAECTIRPDGMYHYHFHLIIEGEDNAKWLVANWLKQFGNEAKASGQDIKKVRRNADGTYKGAFKELFKYFTKLTTKGSSGAKEVFDMKRMDVIFCAMKNKRVFQPFGGLRKVSEDLEDIRAEEYQDLEYREFEIWQWKGSDWVNSDGEVLTNYAPEGTFADILSKPPSFYELVLIHRRLAG